MMFQHSHLWNQPQQILFRLVGLLALLFAAAAPQPGAAAGTGFSALWEMKPGAQDGNLTWADADNDGRLDLLVTGRYGNSVGTLLYRNTGSELAQVSGTGLPALEESWAAWGDYDQDGYQDVALLGFYNRITDGVKVLVTDIYRNNHNLSFSPLNAGLQAVYDGSAAWGDYDGDGDLDLLLMGQTADDRGFTALYRNTGGVFTARSLNLNAAASGQAAWGDYDGDGGLDFFISGRSYDSGAQVWRDGKLWVYRNLGCASGDCGFALQATLDGGETGGAAWIDFDQDGDLDLAQTGLVNSARLDTALYRFADGSFSRVSTSGLPIAWRSSLAVGDYNNDGWPDLLLHGLLDGSYHTHIYLNQNGSGQFIQEQDAALASVEQNDEPLMTAWGDADSDGALDLALSGPFGSVYKTVVLGNTPPNANQPPAAPGDLTAWSNPQAGPNGVQLSWSAPPDDHTRANGLRYELRVGSSPNSADVLRPPADLNSGLRRVSAPGGRSATAFVNLPDGLYYWSLQAVDSSLAGSAFTAEGRFVAGPKLANGDSFSVQEDGSALLDVLANDNTSYGALSLYSVGQPAHGVVVISGGQARYTPTANFTGSDSFNYTLDYYGFRQSATVQMTVTAVDDDPPSAIQLSSSSLNEELDPASAVVGALSATDLDAQQGLTGISHSFALVSDSSQSGCTPSGNAFFTITGNQLKPLVRFNYEDPAQRSFSICARATDNTGRSFDKGFTIQIKNVNEYAPVIDQGESLAQSTDEDTNRVIALSASDDDANILLTWSLDTSNRPAHGWVSIASGKTSSGGVKNITYHPNPDYHGSDDFNIKVSDGGLTDSIQINMTVLSVIDAPYNLTLNPSTLLEDRPVGTLVGVLTAAAPDSASLSWLLVDGSGSAGNDRFSVHFDSALDQWQLRTAQVLTEANVHYSARLRCVDEANRSGETSFSISVEPANDAAPVIGWDSQPDVSQVTVNMSEDSSPVPFALDLFASDADTGAVIQWRILSAPAQGQASVGGATASGQTTAIHYTPNPNHSGSDSFVVQAEHAGLTDSAQVTVNITAQPDPPDNLNLTGQQVTEDLPAGTQVGSFSASDLDGETSFTYSLVSGAGDAHNSLFQIVDDRLLTAAVLPEAGASDSIRVRVTDGDGLYNEQTFTIIVTQGSTSPVIGWDGQPDVSEVTVTMSEDGSPAAFALDLFATDRDTGAALEWRVSSAPGMGQASVAAASASEEPVQVRYQPPADASGLDSFEISVTDGAYTDQVWVRVTVEAVNDAPQLRLPASLLVPPGAGEQTILVDGITAGPQDETEPLEVSADCDRPDLTGAIEVIYAPGSERAELRFTPLWGHSGLATVTVRVSDGQAETSARMMINFDDYWHVWMALVTGEKP